MSNEQAPADHLLTINSGEAKHTAWTVSSTAYLRNLEPEDLDRECIAIHHQNAPKRNESGGTTLSVKCPALIVSLYYDPREVADRVAAILNAHWDTFGEPEADPWRPLDTAPYNTPVRIKAGNMTFIAELLPSASMNEDGECDQWQAVHEGEHPPCWSGGACWASNENEDPSLQPEGWMPLPPSPEKGEG